MSDDSGLRHGRPLVDGAKVVGRVVKQAASPKIIVFKYKPKVRYRKKTGHRQCDHAHRDRRYRHRVDRSTRSHGT